MVQRRFYIQLFGRSFLSCDPLMALNLIDDIIADEFEGDLGDYGNEVLLSNQNRLMYNYVIYRILRLSTVESIQLNIDDVREELIGALVGGILYCSDKNSVYRKNKLFGYNL